MHSSISVAALRAPAYAQAMAARNLQLLQAIESTLDGLHSDTAMIQNIAAGFAELQDRLVKLAPNELVDPAGAICQALGLTSDVCVRLHRRSKHGHEAACNNPALTEEDGVSAAYSEHLAVLERLHDSIEHLRDWVVTHDAILQPDKDGSFTSVDELFKAMGISV